MTASARALLALVLLAGLYVVAAVAGAAWVAAAVLSVLVFTGGTFTTTPMLAAAATALPVAVLLREVGRMSAPAGPVPGSRLVSHRDAPALWAAVRDLAAEVGTAAPAEIRLTTEVNASVTDSGRWLGLGRGTRRLYLGAPLLAGLPPAELRAVLAHELGHFTRHHSWFTEPSYRGVSALARASARVHATMLTNSLVRMYAWPVQLLIVGYGTAFARLTLPVRRRQELEADQVAAEVAGGAALAGALRAVPALTAAWDSYLTEFVEPFRAASGTVPDDLIAPYAAMLDDPDVRDRLAGLRAAALTSPADRWDSHPALSVRLARLGTSTVDGPAAGPDERLFRLVRLPGRRRPWRDWVGELAAHRAAAAFVPLRPARDLDAVLDRLDAGQVTSAEAVTALIGHGLVEAGTARWVMGWVGPVGLVTADPAGERIPEWVAAAVEDPAQTSWLRLQLAGLGLDPEAVPLPPEPRARPRTARVDARPPTSHWPLAVLVALGLIGGLVWAGRDDPPPRRPPGTPLVVNTDHRLVPAPGYPLPDYRVPLPSHIMVPTVPVPSLLPRVP